MKFETPKYSPDDRHLGSERPGWSEEGYGEDKIDQAPDILICQIKIWKPKNPKEPQDVPSAKECKIVLNEVESIVVNSSFKNVVSTASVVIPKGTIVKKVVTTVRTDKDTEANEKGVTTDLQSVSPAPSGEDKSSDSNMKDGTVIFPDRSMAGLIIETNVTGDPATPTWQNPAEKGVKKLCRDQILEEQGKLSAEFFARKQKIECDPFGLRNFVSESKFFSRSAGGSHSTA